MTEHFTHDGEGTPTKGEVTPSEFQTEQFLETINQDVLSGIMRELLDKSDIAHYSDGRIDSQVAFDEEEKVSGWYSDGAVTINAAKFDFNTDYKKDYRRILSAYIHEYVHACATGLTTNGDTGFKYISKDGNRNHVPLNEGFTELIADYVYEEYLKRTGESKRLGHVSPKRTIKGYLEERSQAMGLVNKIAEESGIPEDVVLGAYIRAYFSQDIESFENTLESDAPPAI